MNFKDKLAMFNKGNSNTNSGNKENNAKGTKENLNKGIKTGILTNNSQIKSTSNGLTNNSEKKNESNKNNSKTHSTNVKPTNNLDKKDDSKKNNKRTDQNEIKNSENGASFKKFENENGKLNNNKHPVIGSVFLEEKGENNLKLKIYRYPDIYYSYKEEPISIIFVGESGSGKSTFINAFVNYILGIKLADKIRYKIILENKEKEGDQTQSQTDFITVYYIRSLLYNNKLFQLIDTPGVADTRSSNNNKEKEFEKQYKDLFSKNIGKLNSITFVYIMANSRDNNFQKEIKKLITGIFDKNIGPIALAILTHASGYKEVDTKNPVALLKKIEIFEKKKDVFYYPVNSTSYFSVINPKELSLDKIHFEETEKKFKQYAEKVLSLKPYDTAKTAKNLKYKGKIEQILKIIKKNLVELFTKLTDLENINQKIEIKIKECDEKRNEINTIENEINNSIEQKTLIENLIETKKINIDNLDKKIKENEKLAAQLKEEINSTETKLTELNAKKNAVEKEEKDILKKKQELENNIKKMDEKLEKAKKSGELNILDKEKEKLNNLKATLNDNEKKLRQLENELKKKKEEKKNIEKDKTKYENSKTKLNNEINAKKKMKKELEDEKAKEQADEKKQLEVINKKYKNEMDNFEKSQKKEVKDILNKLTKKINDEIKKLEDSKKEKVQYEETVETKDDYYNLRCTTCKQNCHIYCDCLWGLIIKPARFCHLIQKGVCIECQHSVDFHEREEIKFSEEIKYRPKNKDEIRVIEKKIEELNNSLISQKNENEELYQKKISLEKDKLEKQKKEDEKKIKDAAEVKKKDIDKRLSINSGYEEKEKIKNIYEIETKNLSDKIDKTEKEINTKNKKKTEMEDTISNAKNETTTLEQRIKDNENYKLINQKANAESNLMDYEKKNSAIQNEKQKNMGELKVLEDTKKSKERDIKNLNIAEDQKKFKAIGTELETQKGNLEKKNTFIIEKSNILEQLKNALTNIYEKEKTDLENIKTDNKTKCEEEKTNIFRQLLIVNIYIKEIKKIASRDSPISPLNEIIDELTSDKNIVRSGLFDPIMEEFEKILENVKNNEKSVYEKYKINETQLLGE